MTAGSRASFFRRVVLLWKVLDRRYRLDRKLAFAVVLAAVISGVVTVTAWTGSAEFGPDPQTVVILLYIDTVLLLLLGAIVVRQLVRVWAERRRGLAGSGLHVRIVILFSLVAVTPAILVAVFSALFLNFGIQAWFSERVRTAVEASSAVAQAYLGEHRQSIRAEAFAMANDLNRDASALMRDPSAFNELLGVQAALRSLSEAAVVDGDGRIVAHAPLSLTLELDLIPLEAIEKADAGQVVVLATERDDRVRAAVKLNRFIDAYLIIGRFLDPEVLAQIERTEMAVAQYRRLEQSREGILITFVMIFIIVALLLLLAAVWMGLTLATHISRPISGLIAAAERVRDGDMSVRVRRLSTIGEFAMLGRAFNRMTSQLQSQQSGLLLANRDLDERRRFTEAVLSGVSAGVIGLDERATINLPNRSASELLGLDLNAVRGLPLAEVVPEMADLIRCATDHPDRTCESELRLIRASRPRTLIVRIAPERQDGEVLGYVVTFDDITALVQAERKAAWADVARRIAHEIKNPLTPIQLASERLKRKYSREIKSDPDTFIACTETIIRQVEDIGRMVDEFSSFARMPRPELKPEDICELVRQAAFLERNRFPDIRIDLNVSERPLFLLCDARLVSQALINVLKNAAEAVQGRDPAMSAAMPGWVGVSVVPQQAAEGRRQIAVVVEDNGRGLPSENRDRLTEPYVTTRTKGTGLGLAIVKKIMEDHNGELLLEDREGGGARVSLVFDEMQAQALAPTDGLTVASEDDSASFSARMHVNG
ncbi:MAG: PAS domain-containing sensor histidine kinase [Rhodospirillales bacterium]|nr:PAS domain-containing sensor histidine kinase [Rhodospirillales bacterium]